MDDDTHTVVASAGLADLGGDDFDEILANLALETAGRGANANRSPMPSLSACWRSAASARSRSIPIPAAS